MSIERQMEREEDSLVEQLNRGEITPEEFKKEMRDMRREYRAISLMGRWQKRLRSKHMMMKWRGGDMKPDGCPHSDCARCNGTVATLERKFATLREGKE